jgi:hypothetical protein
MTILDAMDLVQDLEVARTYLKSRRYDLEKFMMSLPAWERWNYYGVSIKLYGQTIVHELKPGTLHATPCWGELFWDQQHASENDPVMFAHFENFAAFMLKRFW